MFSISAEARAGVFDPDDPVACIPRAGDHQGGSRRACGARYRGRRAFPSRKITSRSRWRASAPLPQASSCPSHKRFDVKAQSHLRLDKARIYLARHPAHRAPVPARMHLRGKDSAKYECFMVRVKTKSPDQDLSRLLRLPSRRRDQRIGKSHREALDLPTSEPTDPSAAILKALTRHPAAKLKTSGTNCPEVCQKTSQPDRLRGRSPDHTRRGG